MSIEGKKLQAAHNRIAKTLRRIWRENNDPWPAMAKVLAAALPQHHFVDFSKQLEVCRDVLKKEAKG